MRVTTSDGLFGSLVERTDSPRFFVFQLAMNEQLLGDRGPCILGTAMHQLRRRPRRVLSNRARASPSSSTPATRPMQSYQAIFRSRTTHGSSWRS